MHFCEVSSDRKGAYRSTAGVPLENAYNSQADHAAAISGPEARAVELANHVAQLNALVPRGALLAAEIGGTTVDGSRG